MDKLTMLKNYKDYTKAEKLEDCNKAFNHLVDAQHCVSLRFIRNEKSSKVLQEVWEYIETRLDDVRDAYREIKQREQDDKSFLSLSEALKWKKYYEDKQMARS